MGVIHNRQPVILKPREYAEWLEDSDRPPVHLLRVLPEEDLNVLKLGAKPNAESTSPNLSVGQSGFLFE
jgi:putative SOS response-associated peptidase YedK